MSSAGKLASFEEFARESLGGGYAARTPYPWQTRFAERWADTGATPPTWVIAPTGAGKTAAIEALVWALASQAELPATERTVATRIVWAIDRRVLVDEVHDHASALADRLDRALDAGPGADPLHGMALRLYRLACADRDAQPPPRPERERLGMRPLAVQRWRGGIADREEMYHPFQPQVITSTVAQIGSRLLFRGYGVGERSLQVAAGLAATDTTICVDEAHLALPFRETVERIGDLRGTAGPRLPPFNLLTLTATPPAGIARESAIELEDDDRARLGRRWSGEKTLELRTEEKKPEKALPAAVEELLANGSKVVACVANRVKTARSAYRALEKAQAGRATVALLIGPQRPADREAELALVRGALFDGEEPEQPVIVVATQTIEVGLDADFDGMVSQSASASAISQRLGRLNRSGKRPGRCILVRDTRTPLYEHDEPRAWEWLEELPGAPDAINVSVEAISSDQSRPSDLRPPMAAALTPAMVDQLSQTSPRPAPLADPDIEPVLGGIGADPSADVQVVWRRDLRFPMTEVTEEDASLRTYRRTLMTLAPPEPREILTVSVGAARRMLGTWLADPWDPHARAAPGGEDTDVEGGDAVESTVPARTVHGSFLVIRGGQVLPGAGQPQVANVDAVTLADLQPRDTIVVPTAMGDWLSGEERPLKGPGPVCSDVMGDRGRSADERTHRALRLSWHALTGAAAEPADAPATGPSPGEWVAAARALQRITGGKPDIRVDVASLLAALREGLQVLPGALEAELDSLDGEGAAVRLRRVSIAPPQEVLEAMDGDAPVPAGNEAIRSPAETWSTGVAADAPLFDQAWVATPAAPGEPGAGGSAPVRLDEHCAAVRKRAGRFGGWVQLPRPQQEALELAALAHDAGKLDPRIQDFLWGGSAPASRDPLAKSVFGTDNPSASREARQRANLPPRLRHEALSVAILDSALRAGEIPGELRDADHQLSLLLTGTHHGYGVPLWPVEGSGQAAAEFDASLLDIDGRANGSNSAAWLSGSWLEMLFALRERFGHWGLAYLQALIALADRTVSREEG